MLHIVTKKPSQSHLEKFILEELKCVLYCS